MKTILVVIDGLGDRPIKELDNMTPLEKAETPNLDYLAKKGVSGLMHTLGMGVRPGSDTAHLAIFGYPMINYYRGRGPIEALGLAIELKNGDVAFRGNFATIDQHGTVVDRRAGRIEDTEPLIDALKNIEIPNVDIIINKGNGHRLSVVLRGENLSDKVSEADAHIPNQPVYRVVPLDKSKASANTAQIINDFMIKAHHLLANHPINQLRKQNNQLPANFVLLRGAGAFHPVPSFHQKYNLKAACVAGGGLYKGIGRMLGMDVIEIPGATGNIKTNLVAKINATQQLLSDYDLVFLHIKATDSLAEDGNYMGKYEFIKRIDQAMIPLRELIGEHLVVITADHSTSSNLKAHTADPVPIMMAGPGVRADSNDEFNEIKAMQGGLGHINGSDVMPLILNVMNLTKLTGA